MIRLAADSSSRQMLFEISWRPSMRAWWQSTMRAPSGQDVSSRVAGHSIAMASKAG